MKALGIDDPLPHTTRGIDGDGINDSPLYIQVYASRYIWDLEDRAVQSLSPHESKASRSTNRRETRRDGADSIIVISIPNTSFTQRERGSGPCINSVTFAMRSSHDIYGKPNMSVDGTLPP